MNLSCTHIRKSANSNTYRSVNKYCHQFEICPPFGRRSKVQENVGLKDGYMFVLFIIHLPSELELHANQRQESEL